MSNPFKEYIETLQSAHMGNEFEKFKEAFEKYPRVIILGNGGSNSVASHISQDYMKFHGKKVSILSDPSMLTMLTNDFGYEKAYQKFLEYYVEQDTLVAIMSSGGESKNMLRCLEWCELNKVPYGVLTGFAPDNTLRTRATNSLWNYYINSDDYGVVECVHQIFLHGVV
jgi:D-sedoheptulose 7-phosphate isomerase|tara:strand:- start:1238 stop:1744 length:507 start_codon:yes stop_codon:yes gene_type:complete